MSKSKSKFAGDPRLHEAVKKFVGDLHAELEKREIPLKVAKISFHPHADDDCPPPCWLEHVLGPNGPEDRCTCPR